MNVTLSFTPRNSATMAANVLKFLIIEIIFSEVITSYVPQKQKYIQVPSQHYYQLPAPTSTSAARPYASSPTTAYQSMVTPTIIDYSAYINPKPYSTAVEKIPSYETPVSVPELPLPLPSASALNSKNIPSLTAPPFDSNVLNNLAIALQLLIVSNLLNMPVPEQIEKSNSLITAHKLKADEAIQNTYPLSIYRETESHLHSYPSASVPSKPEAQEYQAYFESILNDQPTNPQYLPNSNFLGSSNILGGLLGSLGVPPAKARPGLNLKSPYDTIASAPENTPSPFEYKKRDFQSPYSAILAADNYKDLFSMDFY